MAEFAKKEQSVLEAIKSLKNGEKLEFRLKENGEAVIGHWINRKQLKGTSDGQRFICRCQDNFYFLENIDYGWFKLVEFTDHRGMVYNREVQNVVGHNFGGHRFSSAEDVLRIGAAWLKDTAADNAKRVQS